MALLRIRIFKVAVLVLGALLLPTSPRAAPANSEGPAPGAPAPEATAKKPLDPNRLEFGGTPIIAGDSDIGIGFGAVVTLARFKPGYDPYRWRLELLLYMTTLEDPDGGVSLPYHDDYIKLDLPGLLDDHLRLELSLRFRRFTNSGFYGFGNAAPRGEGKPSRYYQYDHIAPQVEAKARLRLSRTLSALVGAGVSYNMISPYEGSLLEEQLQARDSADPGLLRGVSDHVGLELQVGLVHDTRDHEYVPMSGVLYDVAWRLGSGLSSEDESLTYGGATVTLRAFQSLYRDYLVLAARFMVDALFGDPPFYQLSRHGGLNSGKSIGGASAVRGVPGQRYHGKVKLLGNLELRSRFLPFSILGQRFNLGALAFFDAGQVFADFGDTGAQDNQGLDLKIGVGGGLRLQWGETFILRADVAWSPDATPVGVYVDVGHIF